MKHACLGHTNILSERAGDQFLPETLRKGTKVFAFDIKMGVVKDA